MLTEREIELAHPEAFDFAFGTLPEVKQAEFTRHLSRCPHCQKVLDEYSDIGRIIQILPPHVEPPADLEDRTVAAMVAALAEQRVQADRRLDTEDQAATRIYPRPQRQPPAEPETRVQPIPQLRPPAENDTGLPAVGAVGQSAPAEPQAPPIVTRLPVWRRYRVRLAAAARSRCHHRCRYRPAQPYLGPRRPGRSYGRDPAAYHYCGQGIRRRRRHRPGNGPAGRRKLDVRSQRAWPQAAARQ